MANADHLIGALVLTVVSIASAEVARPARYLIVPLGAALLVTPFVYQADVVSTAFSLASGVALIALSLRCGRIRADYGGWKRWIV